MHSGKLSQPNQTALELLQYPEVDRRSELTVKEFRYEYQHAGKPVVLLDAINNWGARNAWKFGFFKARYGAHQIVAYRYTGAKYKPSDATKMTLADYIDGVTSGDWTSFPYYIRDNWALLLDHPELAQDYSFPNYFFDWFSLLPSFMRLKYPRIFLGPKGAVTPLHVDIWGTHAWLSQLVGRKRWLLFPPEQKELLYDYQVDPAKPDFDRFPLYRQARPVECTIGPGDTVFVPGNWAHWVVSLDATISLSSNYMGPGSLWEPLSKAFGELVVKRAWTSSTRWMHRPRVGAGAA